MMLKNKYPLREAIEKGIAIDVLLFFTSDYGTSLSRSNEEVRQRYEHIKNFDELLWELINLQLLTGQVKYTDESHWKPTEPSNQIRLTHDTLASVIVRNFDQSQKSGQTAREVLESKLLIDDNLLSDSELRIIEEGRAGMRTLTNTEIDFVEESQQAIVSQKKKRNRILGSVIVLLGIMVGFIYLNNQKLTGSENFINAKDAFEAKDYGESMYFAYEAQKVLKESEVKILFYESAINYAITEEKIHSNEYVTALKGGTLRQHPKNNNVFGVSFKNDNAWCTNVYFYKPDKTLELLDNFSGKISSFSPDGKLLFTADTSIKVIYIFAMDDDLTLTLLDTISGLMSSVSKDHRTILTVDDDKENDIVHTHIYRMIDDQFVQLGEIKARPYRLSPDGNYGLLRTSSLGVDQLLLYSIQGQKLRILDTLNARNGNFSENNNFIQTFNVTDTRYLKDAHLYKISLKNKPREIGMQARGKIEFLLWPDFFVFYDSNQDSSFFKKYDSGSLRIIQKFPGRFYRRVRAGINIGYSTNTKELWLYEFSEHTDSMLTKKQLLKGDEGRVSEDEKMLITYSDSISYVYRRNKNLTYSLVKTIPSVEPGVFHGNFLKFKSADSSYFHTMDSVGKMSNIFTMPRESYMYFCKDSTFICSSNSELLWLTDILDNSSFKIIRPEYHRLDPWISDCVFFWSSSKRNQTLLWHTYPHHLTPEQLLSCFDASDTWVNNIID